MLAMSAGRSLSDEMSAMYALAVDMVPEQKPMKTRAATSHEKLGARPAERRRRAAQLLAHRVFAACGHIGARALAQCAHVERHDGNRQRGGEDVDDHDEVHGVQRHVTCGGVRDRDHGALDEACCSLAVQSSVPKFTDTARDVDKKGCCLGHERRKWEFGLGRS